MKLSRSSWIVIIVAIAIVLAGVLQVVARGGDAKAKKADCCPAGTGKEMSAPSPMGTPIDSGQMSMPAGSSGKDIPSVCPTSGKNPSASPAPQSSGKDVPAVCPVSGKHSTKANGAMTSMPGSSGKDIPSVCPASGGNSTTAPALAPGATPSGKCPYAGSAK